MAVALFWNSALMHPDTPIWLFLLPSAVLGFANAGIWAPLSSTATRNLPPRQAGAGSGVYNMTRQFGSVFGAAAITALMNGRLEANLPGFAEAGGEQSSTAGQALPPQIAGGFTDAMSQSLWLPVVGFAIGAVLVLFFAKPKVTVDWAQQGAAASTDAADPATGSLTAVDEGTPGLT